MYKILMVCTGNICRSPIATGLLIHKLPDDLKGRVKVASAGTHALHGNQAETHAMYAMDQIGIDISQHRARQITKDIARGSDLILTMETAHARRVKNLLGWRQNYPRMISEFNPRTTIHDIKDPYGGILKDYETCIQTLKPCIEALIHWLRKNI
jgi:protein-tyrosine phosphatase